MTTKIVTTSLNTEHTKLALIKLSTTDYWTENAKLETANRRSLLLPSLMLLLLLAELAAPWLVLLPPRCVDATGRLATGKETSRANRRLSALLPNKSAASNLPSLLLGERDGRREQSAAA